MIQIGQVQPSIGARSLKPAPALQAKQAASRPAETQEDRAEFSEISLHLSAIHEIPDVRVDKVEGIRTAISRGDYDSKEVLDETVDRLIQDLLRVEIPHVSLACPLS